MTNLSTGNITAGTAAIQANNSVSGSNAGTISGGFDGIAVSLGTINFTNSGTISGATGSGIESIQPGSTLTITNTSTGSISGSGFGIVGSTIGLVNSGSISAAPGVGSWGVLAAALTLTNNSTGVIQGDTGVEADLGGSSIFTAGNITGFFGTAIVLGGGGNTLTLGPGFAMNGNVLGAGADTFQLGGTGTGSFNLEHARHAVHRVQHLQRDRRHLAGDRQQRQQLDDQRRQLAGRHGRLAQRDHLRRGDLDRRDAVGSRHGWQHRQHCRQSSGRVARSACSTSAATTPSLPAGTLAIEVSPSAASQLKVGGAANLAGTLVLVFDPGIYSAALVQDRDRVERQRHLRQRRSPTTRAGSVTRSFTTRPT